MNVVVFDYSAKWGHFLRAEANSNGLSYPVPPRTALLGLLGAVLGLPKDSPQEQLAEAAIALSGKLPEPFWHKTNIRKDPPAALPWKVTRTAKGSQKEERNFRFPQEWLWKPSYRVWASLPDPRGKELADRLRCRKWHFTPCMGLSEMLAKLIFVAESTAVALPPGRYNVSSIVRQSAVRLDTAAACQAGLAIHVLRMPRAATADRVFTHDTYYAEREGRPLLMETNTAWQVGEDTVVFL